MYEQDLHARTDSRRPEDHAARFRGDFRFDRPARWAPFYLAGLVQGGERKSIEPPPRRVTLPPEVQVKGPDQASRQLVDQGPWDEQPVLSRYRPVMAESSADPAGIFVIDGTSVPRQGRHSVGVQRQPCGASGKRANCQVAPEGHGPLAMRLYRPECRPEDAERLDRAGVPEAQRRAPSKGQIASELLDQVREEGWPGHLVVADAGYGVAQDSRDALERRELQDIVGVTEDMVVLTEEPRWIVPPRSGRGRRPTSSRLTDDSP